MFTDQIAFPVLPFYSMEWELTHFSPISPTLNVQDLIPQVVWRGTDFSYLNHLMPDLRRAKINEDLVKELESTEEANKKAVIIKGMREMYDNMWPRWQSVILTAESEVEAAEKGTLPWANMKVRQNLLILFHSITNDP